MKSGDPDLHVSVFGPDRVLVYAQTYIAWQAVKTCGDRRLMSVDELVVLIEALAPPRRATLDMTVHSLKRMVVAERQTAALMERIRGKK